jgi:hypothetical protein
VLEQLQQQYTAAQQAGSEAAADAHAAKVAEAGLGAFGLLVQFLGNNMLDAALLPNARYEPLCEGVSAGSVHRGVACMNCCMCHASCVRLHHIIRCDVFSAYPCCVVHAVPCCAVC